MRLRNLRRVRQERGLSQARLAAVIGIDRSEISRIENGQSLRDQRFAQVLAATLGVDAGVLLADGPLVIDRGNFTVPAVGRG